MALSYSPHFTFEQSLQRLEKWEAAIRILAIDDDEVMLQWVRKQLERRGFEVTDALSGEHGLHLYQQEPFDFVLTDYLFLPGKCIRDGLQLVSAILRINPEQPMAIHTSQRNLKASVPVLHKPYAIRHLLKLLPQPTRSLTEK